MKRSKNNAGKIIQGIAFGALVLISITIMVLVIWINIKKWLM